MLPLKDEEQASAPDTSIQHCTGGSIREIRQ